MRNKPNSHTPGVQPPTPHPPIMRNEPNLNKFLTCDRATPKMRKRTLKKTHATGVPPLYLTPTEVGDTPNTQKMQNEPNLRTAKIRNEPNLHPHPAKKCETNPIYRPTTPLSTICYLLYAAFKKTNPIPPRIVIPSVGLRSEAQRPKVDGPVKSASPTAIPNKQTPPRTPKNTKRTQSQPPIIENEPNFPHPHSHPAPRQKSETNPIPVHFEFTTLAEGQSRCTSGNPICPTPTVQPTQKSETNPIYPNLKFQISNVGFLPAHPPLCETNPISSPPRASGLSA